MPLFRRREPEPEPLTFTVGVGSHRVVVGGESAGCALMEDIDKYAAFIARTSTHERGTRDTVGVLNAKMDYAELVETMVSVLILAFEELVERGLVAQADVPRRPAPVPLGRDLVTYDYIQETYERAQQRCAWARDVDVLLAERAIAVLWPLT